MYNTAAGELAAAAAAAKHVFGGGFGSRKVHVKHIPQPHALSFMTKGAHILYIYTSDTPISHANAFLSSIQIYWPGLCQKVELEGGGRAPKGHFVVYVGNEMKRFVVPTSYLKNPIFQKLLDKAAEEFGFDNRKWNSFAL
uniref:Auxin-responsive protein n=1 Tax=Salix viminalis TaxID=40686 RepID=A0A6N2MAK1_SALVM